MGEQGSKTLQSSSTRTRRKTKGESAMSKEKGTTQKAEVGLWGESYGQVGAALKALQDHGVGRSHLKKLRADPGYAQRVAQAFLRVRDEKSAVEFGLMKDFRRACMILGEDIVFPDEIAEAFGLSYTSAKLRHFAETLPSEEVLRWCKENGYAIVAGPPKPVSFLDIRSSSPENFIVKSGGWIEDENQLFGKEDKANHEWLMIRKGTVPRCFMLEWDNQIQFLSSEERVPNVAELVWFIIAFYRVRKVFLFNEIYVRTSSITLNGQHVEIGVHDSSTILIASPRSNNTLGLRLGIASARKLS